MKFAFHFLKIFVLLGGAQFSIQQTTTTANPECSGMDKAVQHAQNAIKRIPTVKNLKCKRNRHCSGFSCTGTRGGKPLNVTLELLQCDKPIKAHVDFTNGNIKFHHDVQDGRRYKVSNIKALPITLKIKLKRNGNVVMAVAELEICFGTISCQRYELLNQNFTVVMKNCPGYSTASTVPYTGTRTTEGAHRPTTVATSHTAHSSKKPPPTRKIVTSSFSQKPKSHTQGHTTETMTTQLPSTVTEKPRHSAKDTSSMPSRAANTTKKPSVKSHEPIHAKQRGAKKSGLTSGQIAGIAVGCILGVLVVLGVLFYYKRFYRRSRLRAAYYNDISMNDPLYDDFGPEEA